MIPFQRAVVFVWPSLGFLVGLVECMDFLQTLKPRFRV